MTYRRRSIEHMLQVEASQKSRRAFSQEELLQGLLNNNSHLSRDCGELLLQRGATKVAEGKDSLSVILRDGMGPGLCPAGAWHVQCLTDSSIASHKAP